MKEKIGRYEFLAEPFHCDFSGRLLMGHLGNHLINAADYHANDRDFGLVHLQDQHLAWVLSRLVIETTETPAIYDRLAISTWVQSAVRYFTKRNFVIANAADDRVYGYGRSVWAMIDTHSRQPVDLLNVNGGALLNYVTAEPACPIAPPSRVNMSGAEQLVGRHAVRYSDLDINGHVNSIRYLEHVIDLWPAEFHRTHRLSRIDIAYVSETHPTDTLAFYREQTGDEQFAVSVRREPADGSEPQEACRVQLQFAAQ